MELNKINKCICLLQHRYLFTILLNKFRSRLQAYLGIWRTYPFSLSQIWPVTQSIWPLLTGTSCAGPCSVSSECSILWPQIWTRVTRAQLLPWEDRSMSASTLRFFVSFLYSVEFWLFVLFVCCCHRCCSLFWFYGDFFVLEFFGCVVCCICDFYFLVIVIVFIYFK